MDSSITTRLHTVDRRWQRLGGRMARTSVGVLVLLMLYTALVACGPSGAGCRRASSSLFVSDTAGVAPSRVATLIGPLSAYASPKDERRFNCTKQESPFWQKLDSYRGSIKTNGKKGKKARFYEWDYTHNDIEEYGPAPKYEHLGSRDPIDGDQYKGRVKGRDLRDELK